MMFVSLAAVATTIVYAQDSSIVFYPPQDDASDQIPSFEVTAGDTINITWSATFQSVDLHIEAWAPDSNFSVTPYYNPGLDSNSYFPYVLQPRDYLVNDTSTNIPAYFLLTDHADNSQFIKTQNFTIKQPKQQSVNPQGQITIPSGASTWTGSVTLLTSQGGEQFVTGPFPAASSATATSLPPDSTVQATSLPVSSTTSSGTTGFAPATTSPSIASPASDSSSTTPEGLSEGAKVGIGVGVTVGLLLLGALAVLAILLARSKRKVRRSNTNQNGQHPSRGAAGLAMEKSEGQRAGRWYEGVGEGYGSMQGYGVGGHGMMTETGMSEVDGSGRGMAPGWVSELDSGSRVRAVELGTDRDERG